MKNNIDCLAILEYYNLEKIAIKNTNIIAICPFHQDTNPSFSMDRSTGSWYCFGCGESGNLYRFIELMEKVPTWKAILLVIKLSKGLLSQKKINRKIKKKENKVIIYAEKYLKSFQYRHSWLYQEGFTEKVLKEWEVGYCKIKNAISIPVRNKKQQLIGVIFRKLIGKPKYLYMRDFPKSKILFGINKIQDNIKNIIVTEGSLDVIWLYQWGYKNVVSILGNLASTEQLKQLLQFDTINLCLDRDKAGLNGTKRIIDLLKDKAEINFILVPFGKKDIRECNPNEIKKVMKNKISITRRLNGR